MPVPKIVTAARKRPKFFIVHGPEGVGKTSLAAYAPDPVFIQVGNETGLETLINANQLPEIPHFEGECRNFCDLLANLHWLLKEEHNRKTVVVDTLNAAEGLAHELVLERDYNGDNSEKGFFNYYVGYKTALKDWQELLKLFDLLRTERNMGIIGLCHTIKRVFNNPEGKDYDRFEPAFAARDTWNVTHRAADAVLYLTFYTEVESNDSKRKGTKGKASGGQHRVIYTERTATYDAKNRFGLPEDIDADGGGNIAWKNLASALVAAHNKKET